jgi:hypothetical protein
MNCNSIGQGRGSLLPLVPSRVFYHGRQWCLKPVGQWNLFPCGTVVKARADTTPASSTGPSGARQTGMKVKTNGSAGNGRDVRRAKAADRLGSKWYGVRCRGVSVPLPRMWYHRPRGTTFPWAVRKSNEVRPAVLLPPYTPGAGRRVRTKRSWGGGPGMREQAKAMRSWHG